MKNNQFNPLFPLMSPRALGEMLSKLTGVSRVGAVAEAACVTCRAIAISGMGPSHNGSRLCRMRTSIASGGDRSHCTCAACF